MSDNLYLTKHALQLRLAAGEWMERVAKIFGKRAHCIYATARVTDCSARFHYLRELHVYGDAPAGSGARISKVRWSVMGEYLFRETFLLRSFPQRQLQDQKKFLITDLPTWEKCDDE